MEEEKKATVDWSPRPTGAAARTGNRRRGRGKTAGRPRRAAPRPAAQSEPSALEELAEEKAADALAAARTTEENAEALLDALDRSDPLPTTVTAPEAPAADSVPKETGAEPQPEPPADVPEAPADDEPVPLETDAVKPQNEPETPEMPAKAVEEAPTENTPTDETPAEAAEEADAPAAPDAPQELQEPDPPEEPAEPEEPDVPEIAEPAETVEPAEETAPAEPAAEPTEKATEPPAAEAPEQPEEEPEEPEQPPQEPEQTAAPAEPTESAAEPEKAEISAEAEPAEMPETSSDAEPAPAGAAADEEPDPLPQNDAQRISDMSRTVQLSLEKILAGTPDAAPQPPEPAEEPAEPDAAEAAEAEAAPPTLRDHVTGALSGVGKWLLLVVFFVLLIACGGVAWLYRSATVDMLPQITVSFAGQELAPTAYKWKVPVVGNIFKRTYAKTLNTAATALESDIEQASPDLLVSSSEYETQFTVTDSEQNTLFDGTASEFASYRFAANGTYTGKLVVSGETSADGVEVTGSETWLFTFTIALRPSASMATLNVEPGSVAAVRVGATLNDETPTIETELENAGFVQAANGWICYLPIPWDQKAGTVTVQVTADGYTESLSFNVTDADFDVEDYSSASQRVSPYIGADDAPARVKALLTESDTEIAWAGTGFVQPFLTKITTPLTYGMTEYVGRSYAERKANTGAGGRTATNTVVKASSGGSFIAPGSGTVLLAEDLGGDYGYTLVIDHGAGLKSIFYGLKSLSVKKGEQVKQGQVVAVCNRYTVCEMRIGTVPIDPVRVWRGQCDGIKYY